jgi:septum formation protein
MTLVLASASPRRSDLLQQIGADFVVRVSDVIEDNNQVLLPRELVIMQAKQKAAAVASEWFADLTARNKHDVVIGADTIVVHDGQVYGKPSNREEAFSMLSALSGCSHQVITGVAVVTQPLHYSNEFRILTALSVTTVTFCALSAETIWSYIATGEPLDKAGAYAIQGKGSLFVEKISGDYTNVVGLPLTTLATLLTKVGVNLL